MALDPKARAQLSALVARQGGVPLTLNDTLEGVKYGVNLCFDIIAPHVSLDPEAQKRLQPKPTEAQKDKKIAEHNAKRKPKKKRKKRKTTKG